MKKEILRCRKCLSFTLKKICPGCHENCWSTSPAKFSPEDKYGHYRRLAKNNME